MLLTLAAAVKEVILLVGYFNNSSFPQPLPPQEEKKYLEKLKHENDEEARQVLIERNLRLVAHVIKKFDDPGVDKEDLISIGSIGLIKAINTFNPDKGARLATYAARCIENEILMFFRARQKNQKREISLQEPLGTDSEGNDIKMEDILSSEENLLDKVEVSLLKDQVLKNMGKLNFREQKVLNLRFGLSGSRRYTQKEIANLLGISRSYVSRIEKRIIQKLEEEFQGQ